MKDHRLVGAVNPRHKFDHIRVVLINGEAVLMPHI